MKGKIALSIMVAFILSALMMPVKAKASSDEFTQKINAYGQNYKKDDPFSIADDLLKNGLDKEELQEAAKKVKEVADDIVDKTVDSEKIKETIEKSSPIISILSYVQEQVYVDEFKLMGVVTAANQVYVNGQRAKVENSSTGRGVYFEQMVKLNYGDNVIKITAVDENGNESTKEIKIRRASDNAQDSKAPIVKVIDLSAGDVINGETEFKLEVQDDSEYFIKVFAGNKTLIETAKNTYKIDGSILVEGNNEIIVDAQDKWGNSTLVKIVVKFEKTSKNTDDDKGSDNEDKDEQKDEQKDVENDQKDSDQKDEKTNDTKDKNEDGKETAASGRLPKTGGFADFKLLVIIGGVLILLGAALVVIKRKRMKN